MTIHERSILMEEGEMTAEERDAEFDSLIARARDWAYTGYEHASVNMLLNRSIRFLELQKRCGPPRYDAKMLTEDGAAAQTDFDRALAGFLGLGQRR